MFVNKGRLPSLLQPADYVAEEQYRRELEAVFLPAWHLVGTIHDAPRSGDYLTTTLCQKPVLVRNFDGEFHAFLNVCAHRHSLLSNLPCGRSWKLSCQYHGWEYEKDGRTGRIPEAKGFKPWDRANLRLHKFRVERCGELLFVSLTANGPSLREFLGTQWESWHDAFDGQHFQYATSWQLECPCNWKIPTENGLESYHMTNVHRFTLGPFPDERNCEHVLDERYTSFSTPVPVNWLQRVQTLLLRLIGARVTNRYEHHLVHPHLQFSTHDVTRLAMTVLPTSPTSCLFRSWIFTVSGAWPRSLSWPIRKPLELAAVAIAKKIHREDFALFASLQQGIAASPYPGVLSSREERIFLLQKYVRERAVLTPPAPCTDETSAGSESSADRVTER
jgi:choline monooxygenase